MKWKGLLITALLLIPLVTFSQDLAQVQRDAEVGDAFAQFNLGFMYAKGQGVPQNFTEAYVWFSVAAASGDSGAVQDRDLLSKKPSAEALLAAQQRATKLFEEIEARKAK